MITEGPHNQERLIPIAETFTSIQGEGSNAGTRMTFFRLAGCTVGKRFHQAHYGGIHSDDFRVIQYPSYVNQCTAFDGRTFPCDTDYGMKERLTVAQLMDRIPKGVRWVSITGGEPLMHMDAVRDLVKALLEKGLYYQIKHLEQLV